MPMNGDRRNYLLQKRQELLERIKLYKDMEHDILIGADRTNTIGTRRIERYDVNLDDLRKAIKELEGELDEIADELAGGSRRKTFAVVPRDW